MAGDHQTQTWVGGIVVTIAAMAGCVFASGVGCSSQQRMDSTDFWLEASPDPVLELTPPVDLAEAGSTVVREWTGQVAAHERSSRDGADFLLRLIDPNGGERTLDYAIGGRRRLPVERDAHVKLTHYARLSRQDRSHVARAVLVHVASPPSPKPDRLVAVVSSDGLVPIYFLPVALASISPTDTAAYQTAERADGDCVVAVSHDYLAVGADPTVGSGRMTSRLVGPGSRVRLFDGDVTYDVMLLDNRRTLAATCSPEPPASWSFAAVVVNDEGNPLPGAGRPMSARTTGTEPPPKDERIQQAR